MLIRREVRLEAIQTSEANEIRFMVGEIEVAGGKILTKFYQKDKMRRVIYLKEVGFDTIGARKLSGSEECTADPPYFMEILAERFAEQLAEEIPGLR